MITKVYEFTTVDHRGYQSGIQLWLKFHEDEDRAELSGYYNADNIFDAVKLIEMCRKRASRNTPRFERIR